MLRRSIFKVLSLVSGKIAQAELNGECVECSRYPQSTLGLAWFAAGVRHLIAAPVLLELQIFQQPQTWPNIGSQQ
jgi:hypothetical protein